MCITTSLEAVKKSYSDFSQWRPVTGQEVMGTNLNTFTSHRNRRKTLFALRIAEQIAQRVSIHRDVQNVPGHCPWQPALADAA